MTSPLSKNVVVTGAGSGIGRALTLRLLAAGHGVVGTGRDESRLAALHDAAPAEARLHTLVADAASWADNQRVVECATARLGGVDAVVANAGFTTPGTIRTADPESWQAMVLTNVLGPALLVRAAVDQLAATRGRVIIVGSVAGHKNSPGNLYSATKWAMTGLAENVRMDLAELGIGVTLLSPGVVDTAFYPAGVPTPTRLGPDSIAAAAVWALDQPGDVDVNTLVVRPTGQPF